MMGATYVARRRNTAVISSAFEGSAPTPRFSSRDLPDSSRSTSVQRCHRIERGLGLPRHIGVPALPCDGRIVEHLHDAAAHEVEIDTRIIAVRKIVAREGVDERGIDTLFVVHR